MQGGGAHKRAATSAAAAVAPDCLLLLATPTPAGQVPVGQNPAGPTGPTSPLAGWRPLHSPSQSDQPGVQPRQPPGRAIAIITMAGRAPEPTGWAQLPEPLLCSIFERLEATRDGREAAADRRCPACLPAACRSRTQQSPAPWCLQAQHPPSLQGLVPSCHHHAPAVARVEPAAALYQPRTQRYGLHL